ncbi:hypothetical protein C8R43DRAFT_518747 [Mycena crocata]|nr:hypothetical protein C8R43DRAFT_518747 [Mycena crocata]
MTPLEDDSQYQLLFPDSRYRYVAYPTLDTSQATTYLAVPWNSDDQAAPVEITVEGPPNEAPQAPHEDLYQQQQPLESEVTVPLHNPSIHNDGTITAQLPIYRPDEYNHLLPSPTHQHASEHSLPFHDVYSASHLNVPTHRSRSFYTPRPHPADLHDGNLHRAYSDNMPRQRPQFSIQSHHLQGSAVDEDGSSPVSVANSSYWPGGFIYPAQQPFGSEAWSNGSSVSSAPSPRLDDWDPSSPSAASDNDEAGGSFPSDWLEGSSPTVSSDDTEGRDGHQDGNVHQLVQRTQELEINSDHGEVGSPSKTPTDQAHFHLIQYMHHHLVPVFQSPSHLVGNHLPEIVKISDGKPAQQGKDSPRFRSEVGSKAGRKAAHNRRKDKTKRGAHVCEYCDADFTAKHNLKNHINSHKLEKAFVCDMCLESFGTKHVLTRHQNCCRGGNVPHDQKRVRRRAPAP